MPPPAQLINVQLPKENQVKCPPPCGSENFIHILKIYDVPLTYQAMFNGAKRVEIKHIVCAICGKNPPLPGNNNSIKKVEK